MKNFGEMKSLSPFTKAYVYLDHVDYLADSLFVQNKIAVKFQYDMAKDGSPYGMVFLQGKKKGYR